MSPFEAAVRRDIHIMSTQFRSQFPDARIKKEKGELSWVLPVRVAGRTAQFRIVYPHTYPSSYPKILSETALAPSPHRYSEAEICWIHPSDWVPGRHTVANAAAEAQRWFANYLVFLSRRKWPARSEHR